MNRYLWHLSLIGMMLVNCAEKQLPQQSPPIAAIAHADYPIPQQTIDRSKLHYNNKTSHWLFKDRLYSGYVVSFYPDGTSLKEKFGVLAGKKQNQDSVWYPDGHSRLISQYHQGKLHGYRKFWSSDPKHRLVGHYRYVQGKLHGQQKKWYVTGELFKQLNFNRGIEEGLQRAYRKNGDLYVNYEAREGRIFGLKKSKLCYSLEDEKVKYSR